MPDCIARNSPVALGFLIALTYASACADDWPQWRGPGRNAISRETGLIDSWSDAVPPLAWRTAGVGKGYSSVVVSEGLVLTTGRIDSEVFCFASDLQTGHRKWASRIGTTARNVMSTPTVQADLVYAVDPDGELTCLKVATGEIVWQHSFVEDFGGRLMSGRGYGESPLIDGDRLICTPGGPDAMMVALDRRSGVVIWQSGIPDIGEKGRDGAAFSSIVISHAAGVRQYVQLAGRGLIGIEAQTGRFLWGYNDICNSTANIPTPIVHGDFVFSANGYHAGSVLLKLEPDDAADGIRAREVYRLPGNQFQNHHGGFVILGDHVFGGHGSNNGLPTCIELMTGRIVWKHRGPGTGSASVVAADGHLYFHYQDGVIALIEANSDEYRLKGTFQLPNAGGDSWSHPVIADGKLFLREQDELSVYDLRREAPDASPPAPKMIPPGFASLVSLGMSVEFPVAKADDQLSMFHFAAEKDSAPVPVVRLSDQHVDVDGKLPATVLDALRQLNSAFALNAASTRITVDGIRQAADLSSMVGLSLELCPHVDDAAVEPLKDAQRLRVLIATGTRIGTAGLAHIAHLPHLVAIDLEVCDNITDASCEQLGQMKLLRALVLKKTAFEPERISAMGLQKLAGLRHLELLNLYGNAITDHSLLTLKSFPQLRQLDLSLTPVSDIGLQHLTRLHRLTHLNLLYSEGFAGPQITNSGLKPLAELTQLRNLNLIGAKVTDDGIDDLARLQQLRQLTLVGTRISTDGVLRLQKALPNVELRTSDVAR